MFSVCCRLHVWCTCVTMQWSNCTNERQNGDTVNTFIKLSYGNSAGGSVLLPLHFPPRSSIKTTVFEPKSMKTLSVETTSSGHAYIDGVDVFYSDAYVAECSLTGKLFVSAYTIQRHSLFGDYVLPVLLRPLQTILSAVGDRSQIPFLHAAQMIMVVANWAIAVENVPDNGDLQSENSSSIFSSSLRSNVFVFLDEKSETMFLVLERMCETYSIDSRVDLNYLYPYMTKFRVANVSVSALTFIRMYVKDGKYPNMYSAILAEAFKER